MCIMTILLFGWEDLNDASRTYEIFKNVFTNSVLFSKIYFYVFVVEKNAKCKKSKKQRVFQIYQTYSVCNPVYVWRFWTFLIRSGRGLNTSLEPHPQSMWS